MAAEAAARATGGSMTVATGDARAAEPRRAALFPPRCSAAARAPCHGRQPRRPAGMAHRVDHRRGQGRSAGREQAAIAVGRTVCRADGTPADLTKVRQSDLFVVSIKGTRTERRAAPAAWSSICCRPGFEIETATRDRRAGAAELSVAQGSDRDRLRRGARRPLCRGARPRRRRQGFHPRLYRARGDAGRVRVSRGRVEDMYGRETAGRTAIGKLTVAAAVSWFAPQPTSSPVSALAGRRGETTGAGCGWALPASHWLLRYSAPILLPRRRWTAAASSRSWSSTRDGSILRGFLTADGKWRLPTAADDVDPLYSPDADRLRGPPLRRASRRRSARGAARRRPASTHGRIVSGASTLTMQAVRLLERGRAPSLRSRRDRRGARRWSGGSARTRSSALYLTLAPFGGNLEGVRAASLAYFGKEPRASVGRRGGAAGRHPAIAGAAAARPASRGRAARPATRCCAAMAGGRRDRPRSFDEARAEPVPTARLAMPLHAPHLARALRAARRPAAAVPHDDRRRCCSAARGPAAPRGAALDRRRTIAAMVDRQPRAAQRRRLCRATPISARRAGAARSTWCARCARPARR